MTKNWRMKYDTWAFAAGVWACLGVNLLARPFEDKPQWLNRFVWDEIGVREARTGVYVIGEAGFVDTPCGCEP